MKIKKSFLAALIAALPMSLAPAGALDLETQLPFVPLIEQTSETYSDNRGLIQLENGSLVAIYDVYRAWNDVDILAVASNDGGATWGQPTLVTNVTSMMTGMLSLSSANDNKFVIAIPSGFSLGDDVISRTGSVTGNAVTIDTPVTLYDNEDSAAIISYFANIQVVFDGNDLYAFVSTYNSSDQSIGNRVLEFKSSDDGQNWSLNSTIFETTDAIAVTRVFALALNNGERVVVPSASVSGTNTYKFVIASSSQNSWSIKHDFLNESNFVSIEPVNNGLGVAVVVGEFSTTPKVLVWPTMDSAPNIHEIETLGNTGSFEVKTDGKSKIVVSFHDRENAQGYGALDVVTLVSTDMGANFTKTIHASLPDGTQPQDHRFYAGKTLVSPEGEILRLYYEGVADKDGTNLHGVVSSDSGVTWSEPKLVIDGASNDFWSEKGFWNAGQSPLISLTLAYDLQNNYNYAPVLLTFAASEQLPEKLGFKASFKYGALKLGAGKKATLKEWAESIPDGTVVRVTAPNFEKPDAKLKATRSLKRAQQVANILTNAGLDVQLVRGKLVKWVDPAKGRLVKVRLLPLER